MGDECGVVSIPFDVIDNVLKEAYKILDNEDHIANQLNHGESFLDILRSN
jgi:regulator of RNase E activity RraA